MTVREWLYQLERVGGRDLDSEVVVLVHRGIAEDRSEYHRTATLEGRHWSRGSASAPAAEVSMDPGLPPGGPPQAKFLVVRLGPQLVRPTVPRKATP